MTAYNLRPPDILPTLLWREKKEQRRRLLEAVRHRRLVLYRKLQERKKAMKPGFSED